MLSLFVSEASVANYLSRLTERQKRDYHAAFSEGRVEISFRFRNQKLTYIACYQDEYGEYSVTSEGKLEVHPADLSYALLAFVRTYDAHASEEELKNAYGEDYVLLRKLAELGPKKAKAFAEASRRIDDLAKRIELGREKTAAVPPSLRFVVKSERGVYEVFAKVGFDRLYVNRRFGAFIMGYFQDEDVLVHRTYVSLPQNAFDPATEAGLQFLYRRLKGRYYYDDAGEVRLNPETFLDFLFAIEGSTIELDGQNVDVPRHVDVSLSLSDEGELILEPEFERKGLCQFGQRAFRLNEGKLELYQFASAAAGELFGFFQSLGGLEGSFVADELARKVLPSFSEKELKIGEGFAKQHPILRPKIEFYVGLENDSRLSFETKYYVGIEGKTADEFMAFGESFRRQRERFLEELQRLGLLETGQANSDDAIVAFLQCDLTALQTLCTVFVSEDLQRKSLAGTPQFNFESSSGEDWFSLTLHSDEYSEDELKSIYDAFVRKKKFVRLRDKFVMIDPEDAQLSALAESFDVDELGKELPLYQALKVPSITGNVDEEIKSLIAKVEDYSIVDVSALPATISSAMRPYQKAGIQFLANLYSLGLSGILSDDMGLGKTLQSFGMLSLMDTDKPILVVCPKSLVYNWMAEREKWYPDLPAYILMGSPMERQRIYANIPKAGKAAYFISYDTLRNDIEKIKGIEFACVLLDEGQYISNAVALKTRAVKMIQAEARFVLTGTPVQNSLVDLWSIFDFLLPGYFPPLRKFKEIYGGLEINSDAARKRLLGKVKPFLLGRKKKDVLTELPDKENILISIALEQNQQKVYEAHLAKARELLQGHDATSRINILAMMTRLRQICVTPSLFLEGEYGSEKVDYLIKSLLDLKKVGRKAIVFSSFVGALSILEKRCEEAGLSTEKITGDTSAKVRVILADRFNAPDSPIDVMLVSLKAGGTGLNLIGADTVFHLDPWWNLAAERQAEDRAHRIGQKRKVTVFKLIAKGTIEEKVVSLQERKGLLIDLTDEASLDNALTDEDIRYLLS